ncbi:MAG: hypothetical protein P1U58_10230 [Verrucomicrobiales bacterium]|nr:hypothetical protein [Verrucomicrobiales bacterium]
MKEEELDQLLTESFSEEDRKLLKKLSHDPSVFEMIGDSFRGRNRWITVYATIWIFIFLGGAIWCGMQFAAPETDTTKEIVGWGIGAAFCIMVVGLLKMWFWLDMHRNAIVREIKRLELAISGMSE